MALWEHLSGRQKAGLAGGVAVLALGLGWLGTNVPTGTDKVSVKAEGGASAPRGGGESVQKVPVQPDYVTVYVSGAVRNPGVYRSQPEAIVQDLIRIAGGPNPDADLTKVNLASKITDHMQINVPVWGEKTPKVQPETPGGVVSINLGTKEELMTLPDIGEVTAQKIIDYRTEHGPFARVEDLALVPGIGEKTVQRVLGRVSL